MIIYRIIHRRVGNIAIVVLIGVIVFMVLFTFIIDACLMLVGRERTKTAADAIALAIAQEMLFLNYQELYILAEEVAKKHNCRAGLIDIKYDMIYASAVSEIELLLLDVLWPTDLEIISSISSVEIIYPWDIDFGLCRHYEFNFK